MGIMTVNDLYKVMGSRGKQVTIKANFKSVATSVSNLSFGVQ